MIPYLRKAQEHNYSVIILNPNIHYDPSGEEIRFHKDRESHCSYIWSTVIPLCPAKNLFIASHSAGGYSSYKLLTNYSKLIWLLVR